MKSQTISVITTSQDASAKHSQDPFSDKPSSHAGRVAQAWKLACDKRGEAYANDIFPTGKTFYVLSQSTSL